MSTEDGKLVVNLLGAPNAGKTVVATSLFARLKKRHADVVLVSEYAHQMVVEENKTALADQLFIWANQSHRIFAGYRHAKLVVTDSPILLGAIYNRQSSIHLQEVILAEHRKYNNFNIILDLDASYPYSMVGRIHNFDESVQIGDEIMDMLTTHDIPFLKYKDFEPDEIVDLILSAVE
jgi:AAA domain-containing protein